MYLEIIKILGNIVSLNGYKKLLLCSLCFVFFCKVANAASIDYTQDLNDFINIEMKQWVNGDLVIDTLARHNEKNANLSEANLKIEDNNWRSELRKFNQPLISEIMGNELSTYLKKILEDGKGVYTEIIIIDSKGLNAAQTIISENYWNVGRPRWDKTFLVKSYSPYISEVHYSDETNKFQAEVSFMIIRDEQPIGVVFAGIDVEQLEDWKKNRK